jgi:hypothetical protein
MLRISFENVNMMIQNPYWLIITGDYIYIYYIHMHTTQYIGYYNNIHNPLWEFLLTTKKTLL